MSCRALRALVVAVVVAAVSLSASWAGGTAETPAGTKPAAAPQSAAGQPEALTLPITKDKIKLSYWSAIGRGSQVIKNRGEVLTYQEWEKRTGIDLEFRHPPVGNEAEQFNLMVASRQLPDFIETTWFNVVGGPAAFISDKVILPLNDLMKKYAPNISKVYEQYPDIRIDGQMDDGTFYMMPCLYLDKVQMIWAGPVVRGDWLKKLGLPPADKIDTVDDYYKVLTAFRDKDPNGNGKQDEIPLTFAGKTDIDNYRFLVSTFGVLNGFYRDASNKVHFGPIEPGYKEYLKTMAKWYSEKLIDPEFAVNKGKQVDDKVISERAGMVVVALGGGVTRYTGIVRPKNPSFVLNVVKYPVLKAGEAPIAGQADRRFKGDGVAITSATKYPREAIKMMDYLYSDEGHNLASFGIEGVTYKVVDGKKVYTDLILKNPEGIDVNSATAKYLIVSDSCAQIKDPLYSWYRDSLPEQLEGRPLWYLNKNDIVLPPIMPTADEGKELRSIMNEVNTLVAEKWAAFAMGKDSLDNFDKYVATVKSMGIDRAIALTQAQMDRYLKRK